MLLPWSEEEGGYVDGDGRASRAPHPGPGRAVTWWTPTEPPRGARPRRGTAGGPRAGQRRPRRSGSPSTTSGCAGSSSVASTSWRLRGPASSRPGTPNGGGSSATCTTAPSSGWSPSPCACGSRRLDRRGRQHRCAGGPHAGGRRAGGAVAEVRDLARGIHPAILAEAGLRAALESLADRSPVPVRPRRSRCRPSRERARDGVLLRGRGTDQHRQARERDPGGAAGESRARQAADRGERRRCRRRPPAGRGLAPAPACPASRPGDRLGRHARLWSARPVAARGSRWCCRAPSAGGGQRPAARRARRAAPAARGSKWSAEVGDADALLEAARTNPSRRGGRRRPHATDPHRRGTAGGAAAARGVRRAMGVLVLSQHVETATPSTCSPAPSRGVGYLLKDRVLRPRGPGRRRTAGRERRFRDRPRRRQPAARARRRAERARRRSPRGSGRCWR